MKSSPEIVTNGAKEDSFPSFYFFTETNPMVVISHLRISQAWFFRYFTTKTNIRLGLIYYSSNIYPRLKMEKRILPQWFVRPSLATASMIG